MTKEYDIEITITGIYSVQADDGRDARTEVQLALAGRTPDQIFGLITNMRVNLKGKLTQRKSPKPKFTHPKVKSRR